MSLQSATWGLLHSWLWCIGGETYFIKKGIPEFLSLFASASLPQCCESKSRSGLSFPTILLWPLNPSPPSIPWTHQSCSCYRAIAFPGPADGPLLPQSAIDCFLSPCQVFFTQEVCLDHPFKMVQPTSCLSVLFYFSLQQLLPSNIIDILLIYCMPLPHPPWDVNFLRAEIFLSFVHYPPTPPLLNKLGSNLFLSVVWKNFANLRWSVFWKFDLICLR